MGATRYSWTAVCVGCRWGDTFTLEADDVDSVFCEAKRRHEEHRQERGCLLAEAVYVVDGNTDPTVEEVGRALMQPFLSIGATRIVEMIGDAFGLRPVRDTNPRPTITKIELVAAQGLVPEGILETANIDDTSYLAEEAMKEELALIGV